MDLLNPLYKNQGIHVIGTIFTVDDGEVKVLLIKRKKEPYKDKWILTGGAVLNNESIDEAIHREIREKTGIQDIKLEQFKAFGDVQRSPEWRMVAIGYIGVINYSDVKLHIETRNTSDLKWFSIHDIPDLGYDHKEILEVGLEVLKEKILHSDILKEIFKGSFTIPKLQMVYEAILEKKFDRRNFRKKFLSLDLVKDTKKETINKVGKPAKLYEFKKNIKDKEMF